VKSKPAGLGKFDTILGQLKESDLNLSETLSGKPEPVLRRSPRKKVICPSISEATKKNLVKGVFDDSSLSQHSEADYDFSPNKRERSPGLEETAVVVKKSRKSVLDDAGYLGELECAIPVNTDLKRSDSLNSARKQSSHSPVKSSIFKKFKDETDNVSTSSLLSSSFQFEKIQSSELSPVSKRIKEQVGISPSTKKQVKLSDLFTEKNEEIKSQKKSKQEKSNSKKMLSDLFEGGNEEVKSIRKSKQEKNNCDKKDIKAASKEKKVASTDKITAEKSKSIGEDRPPSGSSVFSFSHIDKEKYKEKKKNVKKANTKGENSKSGSDVFDIKDDTVKDLRKNRKDSNKKSTVSTKSSKMNRKRESIVKMVKFSQSLGMDVDHSPTFDTTFKIPKKKSREPDKSQPKISKFISKDVDKTGDTEGESHDCDINLDELLKLPERSDDGSKSLDEVLDEIDEEIHERQKVHEKEMANLDRDIACEKKNREESRQRKKRNASLRDRLGKEVTEDVLRKLFKKNKSYLLKIFSGEVESSRHQAYHKGIRTRHALYYMMITDPFTDDQLKWTLDEIGKVWMKNKREQLDNNEYVWKVLLPETFIKIYMDHFGLEKAEAEKRISETPLRKQDNQIEDSDDDDW
jgi:hypothetical protein